jgi:hypothetical protein
MLGDSEMNIAAFGTAGFKFPGAGEFKLYII